MMKILTPLFAFSLLAIGCGRVETSRFDETPISSKFNTERTAELLKKGELDLLAQTIEENDSEAVNEQTVDVDESLHGTRALVWKKANATYFTSYPDPNSEECIKYSGCEWAGMFAALPNKMSKSWVNSHNIIAVHSKDFNKYKLKTFRLKKNGKTIDAKVYDMCADSDCNGCCTRNSKSTGFLIDIESATLKKFGNQTGVIEWTCIDC